MFTKAVVSKDELIRIIDALELLDKEYSIATIKHDQESEKEPQPRWIIQEVGSSDEQEGTTEAQTDPASQ
jgi:hypothetical protein